MKVRNGFVSNSSSSSFLVAYHSKDDFSKFSKFDGYKELLHDLSSKRNSSLSTSVEHVEMVIDNYLYFFTDHMVDRVCGCDDDRDSHDYEEYYELIYNLECDDEEFMAPINKYRDDVRDMLEKMAGEGELKAKDGYIDASVRFEAVEKTNRLRPDAHAIAEAMCQWIIMKKGMLVSTVEYEDDSDFGAYMEHEFMPFLSHCPRADFFVHRHSMH